jgi:hypothetical protein
LETRLRVARSLVGEERFFENIDRADAAARLKRDIFRCTSLSDPEACNEAVRLAPDDPTVASARAEALARLKKPADASPSAATLPTPPKAHERLASSTVVRRYSNAAPEGQSH